MSGHAKLESIASELIQAFEITAPPIPIESMLQNPKESMWKSVDVSQLSGTFLSIRDFYSPRMSVARMLARHVADCEWGRNRELYQLLQVDENNIKRFARMLVMPLEMVAELNSASRNPTTMSLYFEVPEDDARLRLQELLEFL
mgnify:CR=1 FL=1